MTINWKKTAVVLLDIVIAAYLVLAISVFNEPEEKATTCRGEAVAGEEPAVPAGPAHAVCQYPQHGGSAAEEPLRR